MKVNMVFPSTKTNTLNGPAFNTSPSPLYQPIDCHFTDELEFLAVKKINVTVEYLDEKLSKSKTCGLIEDIYTKNKEEFLRLSNGKIIRLDYLVTLTIHE